MNKRGTDKVLSIYWFAILFIVAGGVVYMVAVFYGAPYDVRQVEANLLINQVADCVSNGGEVYDKNWNVLTKDNFLERCKINFNVEDEYSWKEQEQYYINLTSFNFDANALNSLGVVDKEIPPIGNLNLLINCEDKVGIHFAFCTERSFYVLENNVPKIIKIFVAIKKVDKNV